MSCWKLFFFQKGQSCEIPMSHFTLEATVDEITKMDAPLERGPLLRWQRKAIEAGMRAVSIDGYFLYIMRLSRALQFSILAHTSISYRKNSF